MFRSWIPILLSLAALAVLSPTLASTPSESVGDWRLHHFTDNLTGADGAVAFTTAISAAGSRYVLAFYCYTGLGGTDGLLTALHTPERILGTYRTVSVSFDSLPSWDDSWFVVDADLIADQSHIPRRLIAELKEVETVRLTVELLFEWVHVEFPVVGTRAALEALGCHRAG